MPKEYIVNFREALYKTVCPTCKNIIAWTGPVSHCGDYESKCCGNRFYMSIHDVVVEIDHVQPKA